MNFRTEYNPHTSILALSPSLPVVLAGSCFSQNIAEKMRASLWQAVNSIGTLFNPSSIALALRMMLLSENSVRDFENSLFTDKDTVRSWYFDSKFAAENSSVAIEHFIKRVHSIHEVLKIGKTLIITFGTSICYFLSSTGKVVGNCHKQPESLFFRRRLSIDEISNEWIELISRIQDKYGKLKIVFTVSPVRHLRDGFEGNSRSKATLLLAIEKICESLDNAVYFPAYEIVNDDLRDYRFYASDLTHPSEMAVDYIWEKFQASFIDEEGRSLLQKGNKIVKGLVHRTVTGASSSLSDSKMRLERERISRLQAEYSELLSQYPHLLPISYP